MRGPDYVSHQRISGAQESEHVVSAKLEVCNRADCDCTWRPCTAHIVRVSVGLECIHASILCAVVLHAE